MSCFIRRILFTALFLLVISGIFAVSGYVKDELITLLPGVRSYQLTGVRLIGLSEVVAGDSTVYQRDIDYTIDYAKGIITLVRDLPESLLRIDYLVLGDQLTKPRYLYREIALNDTTTIPPKRVRSFSEDSNLLVSGSKTFALTFSNGESFDLKQSLFVSLNGELGGGIKINAQLSDSQSKLSPEGDSKELSSLDQVFIRVYNDFFELSMGDVSWKSPATRYINYESKIEGIVANTKGKLKASTGYSAENGKQARLELGIVDGKQGPYYLNATGYQSSYQIVTGSESIYQNGILLSRGLDYAIDYAGGTVMFKKLVVSADLVLVFFQYADDYYKQSMVFGGAEFMPLDGLSLKSSVIYQNDDKDNPLIYTFSPADQDSLRNAGDRTVWSPGAIHTEPGQGSYALALTPEGVEYYVYAGTDSLADYNVTFSYVGSGNGDYDEYSSGKFVYRGEGAGSWVAMKRLVAPVSRLNADLALGYSRGAWLFEAEALLSNEDRNTFSGLDDADNLSGILFAGAKFTGKAESLFPGMFVNAERRFPGAYLFSQYQYPPDEVDLAGLTVADSLEQTQLNAGFTLQPLRAWKSSLAIRHLEAEDGQQISALRYTGNLLGKGFLPSIVLKSTVAEIEDAQSNSRIYTYNDLKAELKRQYLSLGLDGLYEATDAKEPETSSLPDTRRLKISPWAESKLSEKIITRISYAKDRFDRKAEAWEKLTDSDVYSLRHTSGTDKHNVDLDWTHRTFSKPAGSDTNSSEAYDLIKLRSSHNLLKQTLSLNLNYLLNQTEFFPSIRELEYIGQGLGLYDSTGVYTPNGDYDYTYIISDTGEQSTEINGTVNLSFRPGQQILKGALKRFQTDIGLVGIEQTNDPDGYRSYIFYPGSVFDIQRTIYGKQNLTHNIWVDIIPGKANLLFSAELGKTLDKRYQEVGRTESSLLSSKLDLRQIRGVNYSLAASRSVEKDSRYDSRIARTSFSVNALKYYTTQSSAELVVSLDSEKGTDQNEANSYLITAMGISPSYKTMLMQKYRITTNAGLRYNARSGSDFLTFLPEKRNGFIANWSLKTIYKLNAFSTVSFEYSGKSYPGDSVDHQIKFEFKAEL